MTRDEIIEMARQAQVHEELCGEHFIYEFAKLVEAKEREACLKICEAQASTNYWEGADVCAETIRARGET